MDVNIPISNTDVIIIPGNIPLKGVTAAPIAIGIPNGRYLNEFLIFSFLSIIFSLIVSFILLISTLFILKPFLFFGEVPNRVLYYQIIAVFQIHFRYFFWFF